MQVDVDRFGEHRRNLYDLYWNRIEGVFLTQIVGSRSKRPELFQQMCEIATKLSEDTRFYQS